MSRAWTMLAIALGALGATPRAAADPRPGPTLAVTRQALRSVDEAPTTPSPAAVARLYVEVGRELRALAVAAPDAGDPLVARYRYIQVQDAMANPLRRRDTVWELMKLQRAIHAPR